MYRTYSNPLRFSGRKRKRGTKSIRKTVGVLGEAYAPSHARVIGKPKPLTFRQKAWMSFMPPVDFQRVFNGEVNCEDGLQATRTVDLFGTGTDLRKVFSKFADITTNTTSANTTLGAGSAYWKNDGAMGMSATLKYMSALTNLYNSCNATMEVEVIVYTPRRHVHADISTGLPPSGTDQGLVSPFNAWNQCEIMNAPRRNTDDPVAINEASLQNGMHIVGRRPYGATTAKQFANYWKIVDREKVILTPGQSHKHYFTVNCNKEINVAFTESYALTSGLTFFIQFIINGQMMNGSVTADTDVTTSKCELSYLTRVKHAFVPGSYISPVLVQENKEYESININEFINQQTGEKVAYYDAV